jgi:hypothetical protein
MGALNPIAYMVAVGAGVAAADPTVNAVAQIGCAVKREHARMLDNAYTG